MWIEELTQSRAMLSQRRHSFSRYSYYQWTLADNINFVAKYVRFESKDVGYPYGQTVGFDYQTGLLTLGVTTTCVFKSIYIQFTHLREYAAYILLRKRSQVLCIKNKINIVDINMPLNILFQFTSDFELNVVVA